MPDSKAPPADDILSQILKNATAEPPPATLSAGVETKKCKVCGAARPEGTDLKVCDYCGNAFTG